MKTVFHHYCPSKNNQKSQKDEQDEHKLNLSIKNEKMDWVWWHKSLVPALGRQKKVDPCEFKASLVYSTSSRTPRAVTQRSPVSKSQKKREDIPI